MHALADLSARADERVAVDHRALVDERANVDVGGRHDDHAGREVRAAAHGRTAGNDAHAIRERERARTDVALVDERERSRSTLRERRSTEDREDLFLDPRVHRPRAVRAALGDAHSALLERVEQREPRKSLAHAHASARESSSRAVVA